MPTHPQNIPTIFIQAGLPWAEIAYLSKNKAIIEQISDSMQVANQLLSKLQKITKNHINTASIKQIIVAVGPGSFTGLRLAISTANTLAHFLKIPLLTISTTQYLSSRMPQNTHGTIFYSQTEVFLFSKAKPDTIKTIKYCDLTKNTSKTTYLDFLPQHHTDQKKLTPIQDVWLQWQVQSTKLALPLYLRKPNITT